MKTFLEAKDFFTGSISEDFPPGEGGTPLGYQKLFHGITSTMKTPGAGTLLLGKEGFPWDLKMETFLDAKNFFPQGKEGTGTPLLEQPLSHRGREGLPPEHPSLNTPAPTGGERDSLLNTPGSI